MTQRFYAHSLEGRPTAEWQPVRDHLENVASRAGDFARVFGGEQWAFLAGLWHDIGKYAEAFQRRIGVAQDGDAHIEEAGRPDHSTAGARYAVSLSRNGGKILAYLIAGHHAGLPDGVSDGGACLARRLKKDAPIPPGCPADLLSHSMPENPPFVLDPFRAPFQIAFFIRMLYSCLVDADFLDTEAFMNPDEAGWRSGYPSLAEMDRWLTAALDRLIADARPGPVNERRRDILRECLSAAKRQPGLFSLTVPTGGGKTLSSLAFALKHALEYGMDRIIYVIPFTSIIEQNAAVFREILGNEAVLEHHGNFEPEVEDKRSRLAAENWDAPLVVTTNVQFFESLYHNRSSRCRKLHNIANSVVILDEAQMLPPTVLRPCLETLKELTDAYHASVVLCTATQPALGHRPDFQWGLTGVREIVSDPPGLYQAFRRVETTWLGPLSDDDLVARLEGHHRVLCIVNTRKHARSIYQKMREGDGCHHLSALMCPAHRAEKLAEIREMLTTDAPCRIISTSLVEAGVDIDLPNVYRAAAGLDSIAQAAGRCNREGRMTEPGRVYVFMPEDGLPPGDFRMAADTAALVIRRHDDILSLDAVHEYFEMLYWRKGAEDLDKYGILNLLQAGIKRGDFPFRTVAGQFAVIRETTVPVIIPYDETAERLIQGLRYADSPGRIARRLQRYTVQIPPRTLDEMERVGSVERPDSQGRFRVLINMSLYREDLGLCPEDPTFHEVESLIC